MINDFGVHAPHNQVTIKVLGVGGGGGNAVDYMASFGLRGVEFIAIDTDEMVLRRQLNGQCLQIGTELLAGKSTNGNLHSRKS